MIVGRHGRASRQPGGPLTAMSPPRPTSTPHPAADAPARRPVCGQRLRRRTEVERDAPRHPYGPIPQLDHRPAGDRTRRGVRSAGARPYRCEVAVIACRDQRAADRRVDRSPGRRGRVQRVPQGLGEHRRDPHRVALRGVDPRQLGVGAEPIARGPHCRDLRFQGTPRDLHPASVRHHEASRHPPHEEAPGGLHHEPPEVT